NSSGKTASRECDPAAGEDGASPAPTNQDLYHQKRKKPQNTLWRSSLDALVLATLRAGEFRPAKKLLWRRKKGIGEGWIAVRKAKSKRGLAAEGHGKIRARMDCRVGIST